MFVVGANTKIFHSRSLQIIDEVMTAIEGL